MYTIDKYIKDTLSLTNSLIIKFSGASYTVNKKVTDVLGYTLPEDERLHKYYMNLSGVKHETNNDVYIRLLEDSNEHLLTKDLLITNTYTRDTLAKFGDVYKALITKYPDDVDYIRGCILPVDIDVAISAKDGSVLNYSKVFIQDNELNLIREIDSYIKSFFVRWYITDYLYTDELYASSVTGSLIATLPAFIINRRLTKVKTNEVHDFHLEHYFRSKLNIWYELSILKRSTVMWLYTNLDYITTNIGKNEIIKLVGDKVLDDNNIGLGLYKLKNGNQYSVASNTHTETDVVKDDNYLNVVGFNNSYILNNNNKVSIRTTTEADLTATNPYNLVTTDNYVYNDYVFEKLTNTHVDDQNTKLIDIDYGTLFKTYGGDLFLTYMDTWLTTTTSKTYLNIVDYIDPNNKKVYTIDTTTGYYMIIYHMLAISGDLDKPINYVYHTNSIDYSATLNGILNNIYNRSMVEPIARLIIDNIPKIPNEIHNVDLFNTLLKDIKTFMIKVWLLDSNINNGSLSSAIKHIVRRVKVEGRYTVPHSDGVKNITNVLSDMGVFIETGLDYDHFESIKTIFKLFTNSDLSDAIAYADNSTIIKQLVRKLTSYTVNISTTNTDTETLYSPYSTVEAFISNDGLINITKASVKSPYEIVDYSTIGIGNDFKEGLIANAVQPDTFVSMCNKPKTYLGYQVESDIVATATVPTVTVEVINSCVDMWIPEIVSTGGNDFNLDNVAIDYYESINNSNSITHTNQNFGYVDNVLDVEGSNTAPTTVVEIVNSHIIRWSPTATAGGNNLAPVVDYSVYYDTTNVNSVNVTNTTPNTTVYTDVPNSNDVVDVIVNPNTTIEII